MRASSALSWTGIRLVCSTGNGPYEFSEVRSREVAKCPLGLRGTSQVPLLVPPNDLGDFANSQFDFAKPVAATAAPAGTFATQSSDDSDDDSGNEMGIFSDSSDEHQSTPPPLLASANDDF